MHAMGTVGMPRDLNLLPWIKISIRVAQQAVSLGFEFGHLINDIDFTRIRKVTQFLYLAFKFRDRSFEIQKCSHRVNACKVGRAFLS